jgi:hypothetical protein
MANRRFIDFPIAASVGNNDIVLIWQDGLNKQTTKATLLQGSPQSLAGLTDVDIATLTNGQILQYNSTTSKWENVDRTDINLSQLGDVTIVAPANGQVLVYNSSTGKWENSSAGYVPYTGAVTTVNLGAQSILAGSFVKAGGTSAQFLKADGSVDSSTYGTGTVTSVALTMPSAFSVGGSPITTAGTLAVTATGTTSQYIRGDGSLATFPALTGFVPYTGATADVNLGTHDLAAERGTFQNNGSSDTLTVNHTSGSGYGIIVTKGGSNEALYVSKTTGSGNAMTVVGGRTSLVDLALSSVTNTVGDFLTLSGGVVHKRTAAQTLTDIGGQAALTNPVTGTGSTNFLPKFTGSTTIGNSLFTDDGTNGAFGAANYASGTDVRSFNISAPLYAALGFWANNVRTGDIFSYSVTGNLLINADPTNVFADTKIALGIDGTEMFAIFSNGNVSIKNSPTDAGFKLDVNGTGRFSGALTGTSATFTSTVTANDNLRALQTTTSGNSQVIADSDNSTLLRAAIITFGSTASDSLLGIGRASNSMLYKDGGKLAIGTRSSQDLVLSTNDTARLTIASTGGATFSSSVTSNSGDFFATDGTRTNFFGVGTGANVGYLGTTTNHSLAFLTNNTEKMRITSDGTIEIKRNVFVGLEFSATQYVQISENQIYRTGNGTLFINNSSNGNVSININGGETFVNGTNGYGRAVTLSSDQRIKKNIKKIDNSLSKVLQMVGVYYEFDSENQLCVNVPSGKNRVGLIAQQIEKILPEAVLSSNNESDPKSIDYNGLIGLLINAIQEQQQQIDLLKN